MFHGKNYENLSAKMEYVNLSISHIDSFHEYNVRVSTLGWAPPKRQCSPSGCLQSGGALALIEELHKCNISTVAVSGGRNDFKMWASMTGKDQGSNDWRWGRLDWSRRQWRGVPGSRVAGTKALWQEEAQLTGEMKD